MKTRFPSLFATLLLFLGGVLPITAQSGGNFSLLWSTLDGGGVTQAAPLGTAFTYQGQLDQNGQSATGLYQMTFWLYATLSGGSPLAGNTVPNVGVTGGLFTTDVDFGPNRLTGEERWLGLTVATNGSSTFTLLQPRTRLAPTPHALYAWPQSGERLLRD
jgi:hypothetical protein